MKNENYEQITETQSPAGGPKLNRRSEALATRLESGAAALAAFAEHAFRGGVADAASQGRPEGRRGGTPRRQHVPD